MKKAKNVASKTGSAVLQKGGHTLQKNTLKTLGLTKEQGRKAIEPLKNLQDYPMIFMERL